MNALQQQQSRRLATPSAAGAPAASCSTSRLFGALSRGGLCHQLRRVACSVASAEETRSTVSVCAFFLETHSHPRLCRVLRLGMGVPALASQRAVLAGPVSASAGPISCLGYDNAI